MGRSAVELLIEEIESGEESGAPRRVILEPELVVRNSSCRVQDGRSGAPPGALSLNR
jgi:DNA-binding LacI/PurR family transcriptional regulator